MEIRSSVKKFFLSFPAKAYGKLAIVCASIAVSAVIASAAGYSLADFKAPASASGSDSGSSGISRETELNYSKLINLGSLLRTSGGARPVQRSGSGIKDYQAKIGADWHAVNLMNGNAGDARSAGLPANDIYATSSYNFSRDAGRADNINDVFQAAPAGTANRTARSSPGNELLGLYLPDTGNGGGAILGKGTVNGQNPATLLVPYPVIPTPLPAALTLFGGGLILLGALRRALKK